MIKNYKELKVWGKAYKLCLDIYTVMKKEKFQELREALGDIERMLEAMINSLENKHLNPGILEPFLPICWEKI